jgi:hypothetical protein
VVTDDDEDDDDDAMDDDMLVAETGPSRAIARLWPQRSVPLTVVVLQVLLVESVAGGRELCHLGRGLGRSRSGRRIAAEFSLHADKAGGIFGSHPFFLFFFPRAEG